MNGSARASTFIVGENYIVSMIMSREVMKSFRDLSGDNSSVHHDVDFAKAHGYAGPIVYGNLLGALVSRLVGMNLPYQEVVIIHQSIDFRLPVYIGDDVTLVATVASVHESVATVKFSLGFSTKASGLIATGKCAIKCL